MMIYGSNAKVAALGAMSGHSEVSTAPRDPLLFQAVEGISRQLGYLEEISVRIGQSVTRLVPPVPTAVEDTMMDATDGTLHGALATIENRLARFVQVLGEAAVQLDRAV